MRGDAGIQHEYVYSPEMKYCLLNHVPKSTQTHIIRHATRLLAVSFHSHIGLHWDHLAVLILVHAILCYLDEIRFVYSDGIE